MIYCQLQYTITYAIPLPLTHCPNIFFIPAHLNTTYIQQSMQQKRVSRHFCVLGETNKNYIIQVNYYLKLTADIYVQSNIL